MNRRRPRLRGAPLALFAVAAMACQNGLVGPGLGNPDKIDGPVLTQMGDDSVAVFVLARTQPLLGPDGLSDYVAANRGKRRSELRASFVEQLKSVAAAEQQSILEALDGGGEVLPLWVVNGIAARITPAKIRELAERDDVAFIYESDLYGGRTVGPSAISGVRSPHPSPFVAQDKPAAWYLDSLRVTAAWQAGATGRGVVIAMLDSGVEYRHPDIRDRMWTNDGEVPNNGLDDDGNGFVDDYFGYDFRAASPEILISESPHGTYVAGILVGDGTQGKLTGVAPDARIMVLRGSALVFSLQALQYALEMGADVVNMSFSIPDLGNLRGVWRLAADNATAAGMLMVSGAGNFRQNQPIPVQLRTPEDIPSVLAVGGVDPSYIRADFSSGGPVTWGDVRFYGDYSYGQGGLTKPDVAAFPGPGYTVLSPSPSGGYVEPPAAPFGNSFSGPQASGIAALVLSVAPDLPVWTLRDVLESTARDLDTSGKDNATGWGVLDAEAAVAEARRR